MRRGERRKGWRKFWKNDDKKMDEMDRKECRKMMKTNKGRRWKMKKSVGWGVCMKAIYCWAWPSTTLKWPKDHISLTFSPFLLGCDSTPWRSQGLHRFASHHRTPTLRGLPRERQHPGDPRGEGASASKALDLLRRELLTGCCFGAKLGQCASICLESPFEP